ncbi:Regulatory protein PchR [Metalysinibacillus saudimassiliensis]|uniref:Regulatory protein PchR n=1 Tax=Metalysinibacillus saudimassiliensis TaxID=1461583 RepID=A0A078MCZ7_9BACL|nr:Regulatory protein PchR [Metalysinibacillus saudimassiliensis]
MQYNERLAQFASITAHENNPATATISLPAQIGEGTVATVTIRESLTVVVTDIQLLQDQLDQFHEDSKMVEFNYVLAGDLICSVNNEPFRMQGPTQALSYFHQSNVTLKTTAKQRVQKVEIRMTPERLLSYFAEATDREQIAHFLQHQLGQITQHHLTPFVKQRVYEILHCSYKSSFKALYIEAKVMELLVATFAKAKRQSLPNMPDAQKLQQIKAIILAELDQPHTVKTLAARVGLPENKVRQGFKQLFDVPIITFVRQQRMEKAAWLLEVEGLSVTDTAITLGYSNMSNFTIAFRKYFGCNPSEYLKGT